MFRQTPAFGSSSSTFGSSFGSNTNNTGFGSSAFGRPAGFGTTTTSANSPFGASTTGSSLFGQQTQASGGSLFGSTNNTSAGFGSMSTFGTSGGLFGSGSSGFNTSQNQSSGFSFSNPTTSSNTGGGLFGTTTTPAGGSLFGSTMNSAQGTTIKYVPVQGTDAFSKAGSTANVQTKLEVICAMKEYEHKSLEELRVEDYLAGRKRGQAAGGFGFGATNTNKFGTQQPTSLFGQTSTASSGLFAAKSQPQGLFGSSTNTGFGSNTSGGGLFSSGTSTFGQPASSASGFSFGSNTQAKPGGFGFGQQSSSGTTGFGANTTSQAGTGFGSGGFSFGNTAQTGNTFGAAKPAFGATNTSTSTGLFGAKPTGFGTGFGTSTASPFGTTNTGTGGGLFGTQNQNKPAFSLGTGTGFGSTNTGFGSGGGFFGQNNNTSKPGGLSFGTGNTFGSSTSTGFGGFNTSTSGGLFGSSNTTGGGLFGSSNTGLNSGGMNFGSGTNFGVNNMQNQQNQMATPGASNINNLIKALAHNPFGNSSLIKSASAPTGKAEELLNPSPGPNQEKTSAKKPNYVMPLGINKASTPKPIGLNRLSNGNDMVKNMLFQGLDDTTDSINDMSGKTKFYPSVKKLGLKVFKNKNVNSDGSILGTPSQTTSPMPSPLGSPAPNRPLEINVGSPVDLNTPDIIKGRDNIKQLHIGRSNPFNDTIMDLNVAQKARNAMSNGEADKENSIVLHETTIEEHPDALNTSQAPPHPAKIKLTRKGYYTLPSLEELKELVDEEGKCLVENFTVGRYNYGNVCFLGTTDVSNMDLDSIIFIVRKEIEVYPENTDKPPVGKGLNRPAFVTLDCVWPVDKKNREVIKSVERLDDMNWSSYLEKQCLKMDATFVEYRPETGSWVFKVRHFSKYGLQDDEAPVPAPDAQKKVVAEPKPGESGQKTAPVKGPEADVPVAPVVFGNKNSSGPPSTALSSPPPQRKNASNSNFESVLKVFLDDQNKEPILHDSIAEESESDFLCPMSPSAERMALSTMTSRKTIENKKSQLFFDDEDFPSPSLKSKGEKRSHPEFEASLQGDSSFLEVSALGKGAPKKLMIASETPRETVSILEETLRSQPVYQPEYSRSIVSFNESAVGRAPHTEYSLLPTSGPTQNVRHKPQHLTEKIPQESSLHFAVEHPIADAAAMMGRSFRVGWGPGLTFVHGGPSLGKKVTQSSNKTSAPSASLLFGSGSCAPPLATTSLSDEKFTLNIEKIHLASNESSQSTEMEPLVHTCLKTVLENLSDCIADRTNNDDLPCFEPNAGLHLLHALAMSLKEQASESTQGHRLSHIVNLCVALWGKLEFYSPETDGKSVYVESQARKEALSQWLTYVAKETVTGEVERALSLSDKDAYLDAIFSHLSARHIPEACRLAQKQGDYRMALLIAQACCGQDAPRQMMQQQLSVWLESRADSFINDQRMTIYTLLAGRPTHYTSHNEINTCLGLDWRRSLALHLWYICPATSTISEGLEMFDKACGLIESSEDPYCEKPRPPYIDVPLADLKANFDICYHLLKVYVDCTHKLEYVLENSTSTPDPMDVTTSWLVWCILYSLGYHSLSKGRASSLHIDMATILESMGHWEWAAFVLMFIHDDYCREKEICSLLLRHIRVEGEYEEENDPSYNEKEEFLSAELGIPPKWLYKTKAIRAKSLKMVDEEAYYLLKNTDFIEAHQLILESIAPHAIVNEDHKYLRAYLEDAQKHHTQIPNWNCGGGIYWSYLQMLEQIDALKAAASFSGKEVERLRPKLLALCSQLNILKCPTAVHQVAVSEMSRVVVNVLRAILGSGPDVVRVLAQQIASLPLTQECALEELNLITHQYLTSIAKSR